MKKYGKNYNHKNFSNKSIKELISNIWFLAGYNNKYLEKLGKSFTFIAKNIYDNYILEKPNLKNFEQEFKIKELAKKTYSSPCTIERMVNLLGFDGFYELSWVIKQYWKEKERIENYLKEKYEKEN